MSHHGARVVEPRADAAWVTHGEAAAITGIPVTTIEWWAASKKINTRARELGPTIDRSSLLAYLAQREADRGNPRTAPPLRRPRSPIAPPGPDWIGVPEAAALLGRRPESVGRIAKQAGVTIQRSQGRMWLRRDEMERLAAERSAWISWVDASTLTGFSPGVIARAVGAGIIERRHGANRSLPGLSRASVEAWATAERNRRARTAARLEAKRRQDRPPSATHPWMRVTAAATLLGVSPSRVRQFVNEDRIPATRTAGRVWLRLDHVESFCSAREARVAR